jgi:malonyl-CoA/methylmalonyl-CoA synthetase
MDAVVRRLGVKAQFSLEADGTGSLHDAVASATARPGTMARLDDDLAALLYTSGTTGRSKGAMITHGNLVSNAQALIEAWQMHPGVRLIHALPIYHVHGLFIALNSALIGGLSLLWFDRFEVNAIIAALPRADMMMGVPTYYTRLLADPRLTHKLTAHMRLFQCGSAPLLPETHAAFRQRTGHGIVERYGMTETSVITTNPCHGERIAGTVGYPLPGVEVRVADAEGRELPRGATGMVEVRGPNVFKGYWRLPDKTREDFRPDGFFITGDQGVMAPDGRLSLVGRAKDLVISGGLNVYPAEIEQALNALPGIGEAAVIGVPHADFGEAVVAVVTADGVPPSEAAVIATLGKTLAKFKCPKRVIVVDELPRNAMGKVLKAELRSRYRDVLS